MALIETHIFSEVLGREMVVNVILPQEKQPYSSNEKLKVLWLLHGGSGDESAWLRATSIERYALDYGIAVITPGVFNSCFTNMEHGGRFAEYVGDELPKILSHMFPILSTKREDNYISGFSNGGYGCFRVGLERPEAYGAIGAFSAGDKSDVPFINDNSPKSHDRIILFGDKSIKDTDHDLKYLAKNALKKGVHLPKIYHGCGSLDPWLNLNNIMRDFFTSLKGNPYNYKYHIAEGYGHTWEFWEMEIINFLEYLGLSKDNSKYMGL